MFIAENKMIAKNNKIYYKLIYLFISIVLYGCSYNNLRTQKINEKGDSISIELIDHTKIDCIFICQKDSTITVGILQNGMMLQKQIPINVIFKITKQSEKLPRHPNPIITLGLLLIILGFLGWTLLVSYFPS